MDSKWNKYFMNIAKETASLSKDPKTKVGAVYVKDKRILSIGYNGAPSNFPDELVPVESGEKLIDQKNTYMCHAELNGLLNYNGKISDLKDSTLYTTVSPCSRCACMIAQLGIKKVIYLEKYHRIEETEATERIFDVCNIDYSKYEE